MKGRSLPLTGRGRDSPRRSSPVRKEESRSSRTIRSSDNSDKDEAHGERHRRRRRRSSKEETDGDLEESPRKNVSNVGRNSEFFKGSSFETFYN